jgi:hypothetical protein
MMHIGNAAAALGGEVVGRNTMSRAGALIERSLTLRKTRSDGAGRISDLQPRW